MDRRWEKHTIKLGHCKKDKEILAKLSNDDFSYERSCCEIWNRNDEVMVKAQGWILESLGIIY